MGINGKVEPPAVEVVEDVGAGGDNFAELGLRDEAGSPGGDGIGGGEPRGDFGEGHPEREGFDGAAEGVGDLTEGEARIADRVEEEGFLLRGWGDGEWEGRYGHGGRVRDLTGGVKRIYWVLFGLM